MAQKTLNVKMQIRRDTATNWETNNPVLSAGEFGYDSTNKKIKIGDGLTNWNNLNFLGEQQMSNLIVKEKTVLIEGKGTLRKLSTPTKVNGVSYSHSETFGGSYIDMSNALDWDKINDNFYPTTMILGLKGGFGSNLPDFSTEDTNVMPFSVANCLIDDVDNVVTITVEKVFDAEAILGWKGGANNYSRSGDTFIRFNLELNKTTKQAKLSVTSYLNSSSSSSSISTYDALQAKLLFIKIEE